METYFKLRTITEFIVPAIMGAIVLIFFGWIFLRIKFDDWKWMHKKKKLLKKLGFKRYKYIYKNEIFNIYRKDIDSEDQDNLISFSDYQLSRITYESLDAISTDHSVYNKHYWKFTNPEEREKIVKAKRYNG